MLAAGSVSWCNASVSNIDGTRRESPTSCSPSALMCRWHLRELKIIASLGRAYDVHLAITAARFRCAGHLPHRPIEFHDNIYGWYPGHSTPAGELREGRVRMAGSNRHTGIGDGDGVR